MHKASVRAEEGEPGNKATLELTKFQSEVITSKLWTADTLLEHIFTSFDNAAIAHAPLTL